MKKKIASITLAVLLSAGISAGVFSGCTAVSISSIEKTGTQGLVDTYTITYTNGKKDTFTVTNGRDGQDGDSGQFSAEDAYQTYKAIYGDDLTYDEFLQRYMGSASGGDSSSIAQAVNASLRSSLKVTSEFTVRTLSGGGFFGQPTYVTKPVMQQGSAVIYKMDAEYTYAITNYHVIYYANALDSKECTNVHAYIYGSEQTPHLDSESSQYVYGDYAIDCEYIGGEISYDVAVIRMKTAHLLNLNPQAAAVETESNFNVGDTVYTIGNTEGLGIAVNSGVVSVDSEYITLQIDSTSRSYRSIRMDAAIHEGNSGGGLFNGDGKLIGINNAGSAQTSSMNYAIPASIVTGVADSVLDTYTGEGAVGIKKLYLGVTVEAKNSRFVYDKLTGYGKIKEDISIASVTEGSVAHSMGIAEGDRITAISINGKEYSLNRFFELGDILFTVRAGDKITLKYVHDENASTTAEYTVQTSDLKEVE